MLLPTEDRHLLKKSQMIEMLSLTLGGLAAEEMVFGEASTGASNDLVGNTELARKMVREWGMSDKVGTVSLSSTGVVDYLGTDVMEQRNYSEETAALVDREVRRLIDDAHVRARTLLTTHRRQLDTVAGKLKEKETLTEEDINGLLGPRPDVAPKDDSEAAA